MKLTQKQIQELYAFTRKHHIAHYDLQTELVDHLANAIEEQWVKNPETDFNNAIKNEFEKFGALGFKKIIKDRKKALNKKYFKIIIRYYLEYFRLPKIITTLLIIAINYLVLIYIPDHKKMVFIGSLFIIFSFFLTYKGILLFIKRKRKIKKKEKIWMLEDLILTQGGNGIIFLFIPLHTFNFLTSFKIVKDSFWASSGLFYMLLISFIVLYLLFFYVMMVVIPPKAEKLLEETYPEYKFVS